MSSFNMPFGTRIKGAKLMSQAPQWTDFGGSQELSNHENGENPALAQTQPSEKVLARVREEAFAEGFAAGEKSGNEGGFDKAVADLKPRIELLENIMQAMQEEREAFYHENELSIVKLAMDIAKKITHRELKHSPEILFYVVREALSRVSENSQITLRVNPEDLKLLENPGELLSESLKLFKNVQFEGSSEVQRGGCIIESETGIVDAQIDMQLDRIEQTLVEGFNV